MKNGFDQKIAGVFAHLLKHELFVAEKKQKKRGWTTYVPVWGRQVLGSKNGQKGKRPWFSHVFSFLFWIPENDLNFAVLYFRVVCIFWRNTYARLIDNTIIPERASVALTTITIECFPRFSSFFCQERGKTGKNVSFISIFVFIFWPSHFLSSPVAFSLL